MNSIFVVTENLIYKSRSTRLILNQPCIIKAHPCIIKAFRTKCQAFDLIEQSYYANIENIKAYNCSNISDVFIGNDAVRIRGSYALYGGFTIRFIYEYRIEEIPFE